MGGKKQLRIGLYGGAFDPVHGAHLHLAKTVTTYLQLDQLIWVPTGVAWHKAGCLTGAEHRVRMLALAFDQVEESIRQKWLISACELDREGESYTIDTVKLLQKELSMPDAKWYLVMGADQFNVLHTWKDWPDLLRLVTLAVVGRAQVDFHVERKVLEKAHWVSIPVEQSALSSSVVRGLVKDLVRSSAQPGQSLLERLSEFVPLSVAQYIVQHGLYQ
ncbi:MAG: nicotinate (nicotinamide) nucleotide adenylyltransferase [Saezia sp.]